MVGTTVAEGSVLSEGEGLGTTATASVVEEAIGTIVGERAAADAMDDAVATASVGGAASGTIEALKSIKVRARVKSRSAPMATPAHGNDRLRDTRGVRTGVGAGLKAAGGFLYPACALPWCTMLWLAGSGYTSMFPGFII